MKQSIQESRLCETKAESEVKRQIFEKFLKRMKELQARNSVDSDFCPELNPDVIVIRAEQSVLLESQNLDAAQWLYRKCGFNVQDAETRDRIRVHPCEYRKIIEDLKAAGFEVNC